VYRSNARAELVDVGVASLVDHGQTILTASMVAGTPLYLAPEAHESKVRYSCDL